MLDNFDIAKKKIIEKGDKVDSNKWRVDRCVLSIEGDNERICAPGLIDVVLKDGQLTILEGSEDSLKFLATSI
ncbi:hypothetical protein ACEE21_14715 [Clostridium baratii]